MGFTCLPLLVDLSAVVVEGFGHFFHAFLFGGVFVWAEFGRALASRHCLPSATRCAYLIGTVADLPVGIATTDELR